MDPLIEVEVSDSRTAFRLYAPSSTGVVVKIYDSPFGSVPKYVHGLKLTSYGYWECILDKNLTGYYYTFSVKEDKRGDWSAETPGPLAIAVSVNGRRGHIIDLKDTNPRGWSSDKGPVLLNPADAVIYELHYRDFSADKSSGIYYKGKFLSLTEEGTLSPGGLSTGLSHLLELGVTHVQLMPSFDFISLDEANCAYSGYNWGYDPGNWNVPEGTYSTDSFNPEIRINEFKRMVQTLHRYGIGVILDVVYNHVGDVSTSPVGITGLEKWFRFKRPGVLSNGSGCGNEVETRDPQMRHIILSSLIHWVKEYHIDGFRFDLMGLMDIDTINMISRELHAIRKDIILYGEGWRADYSPLEEERAAVKSNLNKLKGVAVFSDDIRDALRGDCFDKNVIGFATGGIGFEESLKGALIGMIPHDNVDYDKCRKSSRPYACTTGSVINYVSCHDGYNLMDYLKTLPINLSDSELRDVARLMISAVLLAQGTPFIFCGDEILRDRKGEENPYRSSDEVNAIDWNNKEKNNDFFEYCRALIKFRKNHKELRLRTTEQIRDYVTFEEVNNREFPNLVRMRIKKDDIGSKKGELYIIFNGTSRSRGLQLPSSNWRVHSDGRRFYGSPKMLKRNHIEVRPYSVTLLETVVPE